MLVSANLGSPEAQYELTVLYKAGEKIPKNLKKAAYWCRRAATQAHIKAQHLLGQMYVEGEILPSDPELAKEWLLKAAAAGYAESQFLLSTLGSSNADFMMDEAEVIKWYTLAAEQNHAEAQYKLGKIYECKRETPRDWSQVWYLRAAKQDHREAQYFLAKLYIDRIQECTNAEKDVAFKWCQKAADKGHADAQYLLGCLFYNGHINAEIEESLSYSLFSIILPKQYQKAGNEAEAEKYYLMAANQGHVKAKYALAELYLNAINFSIKNDEKAKKYCIEAANSGFAEALYLLGRLNENGLGMPKDEELALKHYELAAAQGNKDAEFKVATIHIKKICTLKQKAEAVQTLLELARIGYVDAQFEIARMHENGLTVIRNKELALYWYHKAADNGHSEAQLISGTKFYRGEDVRQDVKEAKRYYTLAAEQGNMEAQYLLGKIYYNFYIQHKSSKCKVDIRNNIEAICDAEKWLTKASENGHAEAQYILGTLNFDIFEDKLITYESIHDFECWIGKRFFSIYYYKSSSALFKTERYLLEASENGLAKAHFALGKLYQKSHYTNDRNSWLEGIHFLRPHKIFIGHYVVFANKDESIRRFHLAAEGGLAEAQCLLGVMYDKGNGVIKSKAQAAKWYTLAAEQGCTNAQYRLYTMYKKGEGVPKDEVKEQEWLMKAVANGSTKAALDIELLRIKRLLIPTLIDFRMAIITPVQNSLLLKRTPPNVIMSNIESRAELLSLQFYSNPMLTARSKSTIAALQKVIATMPTDTTGEEGSSGPCLRTLSSMWLKGKLNSTSIEFKVNIHPMVELIPIVSLEQTSETLRKFAQINKINLFVWNLPIDATLLMTLLEEFPYTAAGAGTDGSEIKNVHIMKIGETRYKLLEMK